MKRVAALFKKAAESHKQRNSVSGFEFCLADRIGYLPIQHWNDVVGEQLFFRPEYLSVVEEIRPSQLCPRYALIYQDQIPVAALVMQIVSLDLETLVQPDGPVKQGIRALAKVCKPRVLVCGNLMSWGNHAISLRAGYLDKIPAHAVAEALYRVRRAEKLSGETDLVVIKDFLAEQAGCEEFRSFSYRPIQTDPEMQLELDPSWTSFEDYLKQLTGKYRKGATQIRSAISQAGCKVESTSDITHRSREIHQLYLQVLNNANFRPIELPEEYFPKLAKALGPDFRCILISDSGGSLIGFLSMLRDGDTAVAYYIGFDRKSAEALPVYLRLLHGAIEQSLEWGVKTISFGRSALEPKARLGAKPVPYCAWARYRLPAVNWLLRGLWSAVPHDESPDRSPFKVPAQTKLADT
jgi:hypothetical protein